MRHPVMETRSKPLTECRGIQALKQEKLVAKIPGYLCLVRQ